MPNDQAPRVDAPDGIDPGDRPRATTTRCGEPAAAYPDRVDRRCTADCLKRPADVMAIGTGVAYADVIVVALARPRLA